MKKWSVLGRLLLWDLCRLAENHGGYPIKKNMNISITTKNVVSNFLFPIITEAEVKQAINTELNKRIQSLVKADPKNTFGSKWGEITANMAAQKLGISRAETGNKLKSLHPSKAKTEQGLASTILKRSIIDDFQDRKFDIAREFRLNNQINLWKLRAKELGCSSTEANGAAECMVHLLETQVKFGSPVNQNKLIEVLSRGKLGQPVDLIELHCIPTISTADGIVVATEMDFKTHNSKGEQVLVKQKDSLLSIKNMTDILRSSGVNFNTSLAVVDIDAFILKSKNVDEKCSRFENNLLLEAKRILEKVQVVRCSELLGLDKIDNFINLPEVNQILNSTDNVFDKSK
jgi:hypothetical protein